MTWYRVTDYPFNRENYAELIGTIFDTPPSYARVEILPTFTTQEGAVFSMEDATCPNGHPSRLEHRRGPAGYFHCPVCGMMYDEPTFAEHAYLTSIGDDD